MNVLLFPLSLGYAAVLVLWHIWHRIQFIYELFDAMGARPSITAPAFRSHPRTSDPLSFSWAATVASRHGARSCHGAKCAHLTALHADVISLMKCVCRGAEHAIAK
jgi:hypothetical protein